MAFLRVASVSKRFGADPVLHDVSFTVEAGEIVCLLGPSGCGKTTLLRIIAGLEVADSGRVVLDGRPLDDVPAHRRGFGLMFQDYALFPHKDVAANVAFGLRMQSLPRDEIQARVAEMLAQVGLEGYEQRRTYALSGGEQQRVALARSLAPGPRLLMLDEPLGSLDRALREELMNDLRAILKRVGVTAIYVTHDQQEAFALADRVMIMDRGRIVQQGTPQAVYCCPASPWVARFLGLTNLIPGRISSTDPLSVETPLGTLVPEGRPAGATGQAVTVLIRPEGATQAPSPSGREEPCPAGTGGPLLEGIVRECSFRGGHYRLVVRHPAGLELVFRLLAGPVPLPQPGKPITLVLRPEAITLLPEAAHA